MKHNPQKNPYPKIVRKVMRRILPDHVYRLYLGREERMSVIVFKMLTTRLPTGSAILDIGAYHGEFAIAAKAMNPGLDVYAFEGDPVNVEALRKATEGTGVKIVEAAVTSSTGEISFLQNEAQGKVVNASVDHHEQGNLILMKAVAIDEWAESEQVIPKLMKIDTEGGEAAVLKGAKKILVKDRPLIVCEILTDDAGENVEKVLPSFYSYWYIDEIVGIKKVGRITRDKWRNKNHLLAPDEYTETIETLFHVKR